MNRSMQLKLPWQNRLTARVVLSLSALLSVVMLMMIGIQLQRQQTTIMQEEKARVSFMADGLLASLQTLMLTGNGPLARFWLTRVAKEPGVIKVQVIRRTGNEAFFDLKTIHQVNHFLGEKRFDRPSLPPHTVSDIAAITFKSAVAGKKIILRDKRGQHLTYLMPIRKLNACNACHGYDDSPIRGVMRVTISLKHADAVIANARKDSIITGVGATLLLTISLFFLVRRQVIRPIQHLHDTARRIDSGDLSVKAPVSERHDEIDQLGETFNHMTRSLVDNITQSKAQTAYYHHLLDGLSNGVTVYNVDGHITYVNARTLAITGFLEEEYKHLAFGELRSPSGNNADEDKKSFREQIEQRRRDSGGSIIDVVSCNRKDGSTWIARLTLIPLYDDASILTEVLEISEDITEDQQRQEEIKWLSSIPEMNPFPIIEVDAVSSEVVYMNPATLDYLTSRGFSADEIESILPAGLKEAVNICREKNLSIDTVSFEVGDDIMIWQLHPNKTNDNVRAYAIDVTNQARAEKEAIHLAQHDSLTGLPNRLLFFDRMQQAIAQTGRTQHKIAVLMLDLDRFKPINDELGHDAGDEALKEASRRICVCLRETDTAARYGGDEFVILLTNLRNVHDAEEIAGNIIEALSRPMQLADQTRTLGVSIGIALSHDEPVNTASTREESEHSTHKDQLITEADTAMYAAKNAGRNTYRLYADIA